MNRATRNMIRSLIERRGMQSYHVPSSAIFRIVDRDTDSPYLIVYSPNGFSIALRMNADGEIERRPLPSKEVQMAIKAEVSTPPYTLKELDDLTTIHSEKTRPSQLELVMNTMYHNYLGLDPEEEVVVKDGEIEVMGFTLTEFLITCPLTFNNPTERETTFVSKILSRILTLAETIRHYSQVNETYDAEENRRILVMMSTVRQLLRNASRIPNIRITPPSPI